jgi:hypothetical protein
MNRFDDELKRALQRIEPPEGFTEKVLSRVAEERRRPSFRQRLAGWFAGPRLQWVAAGALCLVIVAGVGYQRRVERRAEGERVKEQVLLALQITAHEIQVAREGVRSLNRAE